MKTNLILRFLALTTLFSLTSCSDDDDSTGITTGNFVVTIENTFEGKEYFANGATGFIAPGNSESFSFNAGKGHYLSFATMYVQSNDLFYGFDEMGIALYNENGNALTGDVTSMVSLWDAGTEVNEEPGVGPNQAPRQTGPDAGADENGTVKRITEVNDGFTYPNVSDVIKVTLAHDGGTEFTVTIENVSGSASTTTPLAPGVWVVNGTEQTPLFTMDNAASEGLERIAEDGDNSILDADLTLESGLVSPFAPGAYDINNAVFVIGESATGALEALAEDGNPSGFSNIFNIPVGASGPGPIFPGESYSFEFTASEGDVLSFATMLVQSNDWFIGANDIELFNNGISITGDITNRLELFDAGTEVDEYSGAGNNQPPRQDAANTGTDENGTVAMEESANAHVPAVAEMIKVTITTN
ncbi:MAG: spondin domain-containing protein [Allomuricauda sp.]|jgi:Spondin_N